MERFGYVAIVDDDASTREALARLLRARRIDSRSYSSARAFLEALPSGMPDCPIVDANMPYMTVSSCNANYSTFVSASRPS
jgi:FixJ family two-component response regulator